MMETVMQITKPDLFSLSSSFTFWPKVLAMMLFSLTLTNSESVESVEFPRTTPDTVTVDQQVAESSFIFIGEPVRIYFADHEYREVPYEQSYVVSELPPGAGGGQVRRALLEIKVVRILWKSDARERPHVVRSLSIRKEAREGWPSSYEESVKKYLGRQGIWFGNFSIVKQYSERTPDGSGHTFKAIRVPVELFREKSWSARLHVVPNPMPIDHLDEVLDSIRRVRSK
jgi:hypothetical protein